MRNVEKESKLLIKLVKNKMKKHETANSIALELLEAHAALSSRKEIPQEE